MRGMQAEHPGGRLLQRGFQEQEDPPESHCFFPPLVVQGPSRKAQLLVRNPLCQQRIRINSS